MGRGLDPHLQIMRWATLSAAILAASPGLAQAPAASPDMSVSFNAAIVSDYRFRGVSYSARKPAVQGGADLSLASGWYAGTWLSNIANYGGAHGEIDIYAGRAGTVIGLDYSATLYAYFYPGGTDTDYLELQSTLGRSFGPVTTTLTLAYTPKQWNSDQDNLYTGLGADIAIGRLPLTASFAVGRETGSYHEKWDWSAGLTWRLDVLDLSAAYVDSNYHGAAEAGRNGRGGALLSARASF